MSAPVSSSGGAGQELRIEPVNLRRGVVASAAAKEAGSSFQYVVQHPVSLPRQRSAQSLFSSSGTDWWRIALLAIRVSAARACECGCSSSRRIVAR